MYHQSAGRQTTSSSFAGFGASSRRAAASSSSVAMGRSAGYAGASAARFRAGGGYGVGVAGGAGYGVGAAGGAGYGVGVAGGAGYGVGIGYGAGAGGYGMSASTVAGGTGLSYGGGIRAAQAGVVGSSLGGGFGVSRTSGAVLYGAPGGPGGQADVGYAPFSVDEKQLLQTLNDRLATYLEKVRHLETTNRELEDKLRAFTINKVQIRDLQVYEDQLVPLRQQVGLRETALGLFRFTPTHHPPIQVSRIQDSKIQKTLLSIA